MDNPKPSILKQKIFDDFDAQDLIAVVVLIGGFVLMFFHIDTVIAGLMTLVVGFYFGKKASA